MGLYERLGGRGMADSGVLVCEEVCVCMRTPVVCVCMRTPVVCVSMCA